MLYVFNTEGDNEVLGEYRGGYEDVVFYRKPGNEQGIVSADCVTVREVTRAEIIAQFDRFSRKIESAKGWVVDGGYGDTGLNSLVGIAAEMEAYAESMGAALTSETARAEVQRLMQSGNYVGARTHSRDLEEVPFGYREPGENF